MAALYFRDGRLFTGTPITAEGKAPHTIVSTVCSRCSGEGGSDAWKHTGWTCYKCNGTCKGPNKVAPLYTQDKLAQLNATRAKRQATKTAAATVANDLRQAETAIRLAEAAERRAAFRAEHAVLLAWLETVGLEAEIDERRIYRENFLGNVLKQADTAAFWSDKQIAAVTAAYERAGARAVVRSKSSHVGSPGQRITTDVMVERENNYERPAFSGFGHNTETVYITTLRDAEGNALIVKSPRFRVPVGDRITIKGTVKSHDTFQNEAQTMLQRVMVVT